MAVDFSTGVGGEWCFLEGEDGVSQLRDAGPRRRVGVEAPAEQILRLLHQGEQLAQEVGIRAEGGVFRVRGHRGAPRDDVLGLQIAVVDAGLVAVLDDVEELEERLPRERWTIDVGLPLDAVQHIVVAQLEDDEQIFALDESALKFDYVRVYRQLGRPGGGVLHTFDGEEDGVVRQLWRSPPNLGAAPIGGSLRSRRT
ncbi:hypothetical protein C8R44DRAFT_749821 [Mycena epipterygia]|nr:hypothetical protein C8R44DRAFT_749821 [Mycena epipterygia]